MAILLDTNILLRSLQPNHHHHAQVEYALSILRDRREEMFVATQNFIEFWVVATRPAGATNGLGMTSDEAGIVLGAFEDLYAKLSEPYGLFAEWKKLVTTHKVSGKSAHDARLAATMKLSGIGCILTFNVTDFARFDGIAAIHPNSI